MVWKQLSEVEQARIWAGHARGEPDSAIGRAIGRPEGTVQRFLQRGGGFAPVPQRRSAHTLSLTEREEISRGLSAQLTMRQIAKRLNRAPSSISREIGRHGGLDP